MAPPISAAAGAAGATGPPTPGAGLLRRLRAAAVLFLATRGLRFGFGDGDGGTPPAAPAAAWRASVASNVGTGPAGAPGAMGATGATGAGCGSGSGSSWGVGSSGSLLAFTKSDDGERDGGGGFVGATSPGGSCCPGGSRAGVVGPAGRIGGRPDAFGGAGTPIARGAPCGGGVAGRAAVPFKAA
jgi:hypothetical protein